MPKKRGAAGAYYYAGNQKISLLPASDLIAIDRSDANNAKEIPPEVAQALPEGIHLIAQEALSPSAKENARTLDKYPVFRAQGAILVALPEVRIEESRPGQRARLEQWLTEHEDLVTVVSRDEDRITLRPVSGSGSDALGIANDLTETVRPEMAQARFLRVMPKPT